jgi:iron(III) transport system ATP-binding protein
MSLLSVSAIKKQQGALLLQQINFQQSALQKIAIAGETGSGKTTLLKIIAGLEQADEGNVLFDDKRVRGPLEKLMPGHKQIAYLSQEFELLHHYYVEELLLFENKLTDDAAQNLFKLCRIDHLIKRKTDQLSGGERQRIALTMLLIKSPKLLILDEPFSNLDPIHKKILKEVIDDIGAQLQITCILTSHDPYDTLGWADEIIVLKDGRVVQHASPNEIYMHPASEYVAGLFGKYNLLTTELLPGHPQANNIIRPEHVHLSLPTTNALNGIVTKTIFYGSYVDVEVAVLNTIVTVRMTHAIYKNGDAITVSFDMNNIIVLPQQ